MLSATRCAHQPLASALAGVAGALALLFALAVAMRMPGTLVPWIDDGIYNAVSLTATLVVWLRSRLDVRQRLAWTLLALGLLLYWGGDLWWSFHGRTRETQPWLPLEDALWLTYYPLCLGAIWHLVDKMPRRERSFLDGLVFGGGALIVLSLLLHYGFEQFDAIRTGAPLVLKGLYVGLDLVMIATCLLLAFSQHLHIGRSWWLLLSGFAAAAVTDTLYWVQLAEGSYVEGSWTDAGWLVSTAAMAWAAALGLQPLPAFRALTTASVLPASLAVLAAAFALESGPEGPFGTLARLGAIATLIAALVRLNVAIRDAAMASELRRRALTDEITGLPNRHALELLAQEASAPGSTGTGWSLLILGLDRFRDINSTLGHALGDNLIEQVAQRIGSSTRAGDRLYRLDGDEFALLIRPQHPHEALAAAERLEHCLEQPFEIGGVAVALSACTGMSSTADPVPPVATLLQEAGIALRQAKSEGPGLIRSFSGQASGMTVQRLMMRTALRQALRGDGQGLSLSLRFQPIVRTNDEAVLAFEALVRWQHDGRLLTPDQFLPEVHHAGLMTELTARVLRRALCEMDTLGHAVTVNVPPELVTDWLLEEVDRTLHLLALPAGRLIIEVTEDALIRDPDNANRVMRQLRARGIRVLLDDFGSGWCGLSAVRDLAVDGLKIDRSFVTRINQHPPTREIAAAIVALGRNLGLLVIGEGAEDSNEKTALDQLGVEYVQGFAICMPMAIDDLRQHQTIRPLHPVPQPQHDACLPTRLPIRPSPGS